MKKITFKVSTPKEGSVVSLIKEVNRISCRIYLDIENGCVTVVNVNDTMIDTVIELVDNYYTIFGVDIDNTSEETTAVQVAPVVVESSAGTTTKAIEETLEETTEVVASKQSTDLKPQSEHALNIKKVEFENKSVETRLNQFIKTVYWAMYDRHVTEKDIGDHILTCMSEISMRYSSKPVIQFSIGDIVDVNYGFHLSGEINGGHVHAVVCNILNKDMAFVLPIVKAQTDIPVQNYLLMKAPQDATYVDEAYKDGTVLLNKGKYVRVERFRCVSGQTKPEFFAKLLHQLASTFDFTRCLTAAVEDDSDQPLTIGETTNKAVETTTATDEADTKVMKSKTYSKKVSGEEVALLESIGYALDKLDTSKSVEEQVESFLTDIGMTTKERMVTKSFIIAPDIDKINYAKVLLGLQQEFPKVKEEIIKNILKEAFKNWLEKYPALAEKCPKISLMAVLKVFAKKFTILS